MTHAEQGTAPLTPEVTGAVGGGPDSRYTLKTLTDSLTQTPVLGGGCAKGFSVFGVRTVSVMGS